MKQLFVAFACLLCIASFQLRAQDDGVPSYSQHCFEAAKSKAGDTLSNAGLTGVGTFPINNALFFGSSKFDLHTAKATAWIYSFRSKITDATAVVVAYQSKSTGQCVALEIPVDSAKVSHFYMDESRLQSDSLMMALARNNTFLSILAQYPAMSGDTLALISSNADDSNTFPPDANLWISSFSYSGGRLFCVYDMTNRSNSVCQNVLTSVDGNDDAGMLQPTIGPNPADQLAILNVPGAATNRVQEVQVVTLDGVNVASQFKFNWVSQDLALVSTTQCASGTYLLRVVCENKSFVVPMIIQH